MPRSLSTVLAVLGFAVIVAGGAAAAPASQPGDANEPENCREFWEGIGLPDRKDTDAENFTPVCHLGYIAGHNNEMKTPDWVVERLTFKQVSGTANRKGSSFKAEPNVPGTASARPGDYSKSGYDKGHQAPAADFKGSKELLEDTFFLSNAVPQVGAGFNRHVWQELEEHIQNLVKERQRSELYVITGPVYQTGRVQVIRKGADACKKEIRLPVLDQKSICPENRDDPKVKCEAGVAVPAAMFKIVFEPRNQRANAFLMPNIDHRPLREKRRALDYLEDFRVSVSSVEGLTGIKFFTAMPARTQRKIRESCVPTMLH